MKTLKETLLVASEGIVALAYSPADSYLIACEKFNQSFPDHQNLQILDASNGKTLAKFQWRKTPKEAIKSIKFTKDERFCIRLVPQLSAKQSNSIEVYQDGDFSKPRNIIKAHF